MKIFALSSAQSHTLAKARSNMIESRKLATRYQEALYEVEQKIYEEVFLGFKNQLPEKAGISECGKFAFYID